MRCVPVQTRFHGWFVGGLHVYELLSLCLCLCHTRCVHVVFYFHKLSVCMDDAIGGLNLIIYVLYIGSCRRVCVGVCVGVLVLSVCMCGCVCVCVCFGAPDLFAAAARPSILVLLPFVDFIHVAQDRVPAGRTVGIFGQWWCDGGQQRRRRKQQAPAQQQQHQSRSANAPRRDALARTQFIYLRATSLHR